MTFLSKKYYRRELLKSIFSLLNGNIIIDGTPVYVGTGKIPSTEKNYIYYKIANDTDIGTFDAALREVMVDITCVSWQPEAQGDGSILDKMVEQVQEIILQDSIVMDNYKLILLHNDGVEENETESDEYDVMYRTINYKLIIQL